MKLQLVIVFYILANNLFCQENNWDPNLTGIKNIFVKVDLCSESTEYDYLQHEVFRDVVVTLKEANIETSENKNSNFLLVINMNCYTPQYGDKAISLNFSLKEKVYIKRIKSNEYATLYEKRIVGALPGNTKDYSSIKLAILNMTNSFIQEYKLDNYKKTK